MTPCHYCSDEAFFHSYLSGKKVCAFCAAHEQGEIPRCINHPERLGIHEHDGIDLCEACSREESPQDWKECHD